MSTKKRRRKTIDDALPAIATVVCAIICDYAFTEPYIWTAERTRNIGKIDRFGSHSVPPTTIANASDCSTIKQTTVIDDVFWHTFVAETNIRVGPRRWTVGRINDAENGLFAVGITTATDNFVNRNDVYLSAMSADNSWMFLRPRTIDPVYIYHRGAVLRSVGDAGTGNSPQDRQIAAVPGCEPIACIELEAIPETCQIVGRLPNGSRFVLMTADNLDEFWTLRPCIAIAGNACAVVMSNDF